MRRPSSSSSAAADGVVHRPRLREGELEEASLRELRGRSPRTLRFKIFDVLFRSINANRQSAIACASVLPAEPSCHCRFHDRNPPDAALRAGQNLDFFRRRVPEAVCILGRDFGGDRDISGESSRSEVRGGNDKHVGGIILAPKALVQGRSSRLVVTSTVTLPRSPVLRLARVTKRSSVLRSVLARAFAE